MILPSKVCINFCTQVLTLSVEYSILPHNFILTHLHISFTQIYRLPFQSFFTLNEILFKFNQLIRCFKSALTSLFSFFIELLRHIIDQFHLQSGELYKTLLLHEGHLYIMKTKGVLEQIPGNTTIHSSKTRFISIYRYLLIVIRQIELKPII